jgi:hypothetical protein
MSTTPEALPRAAWKKIDPATAAEMLKLLISNRRLVVNHVAFLAREMREGRWRINGDTIRFSPKRLLDGQHRLHAVIQSGVTITALVVEEIEDSAYDSIDTGRMRGAGDILSTNFGTQPFMMAAAARFIWYYDHSFSLDSSFRISNHEIVETVQKNPFLRFVCDYLASQKTMRASPIAAALTLIERKSGQEMAMFFGQKLAMGTDLKADDPIRFFRDKWMLASSHRSSRGERTVWIAILIKTFNSWSAHKKANACERWAFTEPFPEVIVEPEKAA